MGTARAPAAPCRLPCSRHTAAPRPVSALVLAQVLGRVGMVSDMTQLVVTQIRSAIGAKPKQRGTLRALGLGRIGRSNTLPDRGEIRGMIARVPHLVRVEEQAEEVE